MTKKLATAIKKGRIASALAAVKQYPAYQRDDLQSSIVDLIADSLLLARESHLDYAEIVERAVQHYEIEVPS